MTNGVDGVATYPPQSLIREKPKISICVLGKLVVHGLHKRTNNNRESQGT